MYSELCGYSKKKDPKEAIRGYGITLLNRILSIRSWTRFSYFRVVKYSSAITVGANVFKKVRRPSTTKIRRPQANVSVKIKKCLLVLIVRSFSFARNFIFLSIFCFIILINRYNV